MDLSGHMLDLEEDEDLEVFTKVKIQSPNRPNLHFTRRAPAPVRGSRLATFVFFLSGRVGE